MMKRIWSDEPSVADPYRQAYLDGIKKYIENKTRAARDERRAFMPPEALVREPERYRDEYLKMLGVKRFNGAPTVERELVGEDGYSYIYRLKIYLYPELPFYVMLLLPKERAGKAPLVVFQHGGGGTPELASDFYGKNNYNHGVRRVVERGAAVLLPQLLIWARSGSETARAHPIDFNRTDLDKELKRIGTSITGLEVSCIIRSIDYAVTLDEIDPERIAMTGLSYGGYFTLHTMAADTRIKAGYTAGAFNDRDAYPRYDWTYFDSTNRFHDAEVAALCAPRRLAIQVGMADPVLDYRTAIPEMERVKDYFSAYGKGENLKLSVWEGGHTFSDSDECFDFLFEEL